jgi:hypothetical protein
VRRLFLGVRTVTACPQTIKTHRLNMFFALFPFLEVRMGRCTDKKENLIFLIYKEIQNGAVAKSYMTNGLLIYGEIFAHFLIYFEALSHI